MVDGYGFLALVLALVSAIFRLPTSAGQALNRLLWKKVLPTRKIVDSCCKSFAAPTSQSKVAAVVSSSACGVGFKVVQLDLKISKFFKFSIWHPHS